MNAKSNAIERAETAVTILLADEKEVASSRDLLVERIREANEAGASDGELARRLPYTRQRIQQLRTRKAPDVA